MRLLRKYTASLKNKNNLFYKILKTTYRSSHINQYNNDLIFAG